MTHPVPEWVATFAVSVECDRRSDGLWIFAPQIDVQALARTMNDRGFRLSTMTGLALAEGETAIVYHYVSAGNAVNVKTHTHGGTLPSITPLVRAASWIEREIHDFFGVEFSGHPNLAPLMRPAELPQGFFRNSPDAATGRASPGTESP